MEPIDVLDVMKACDELLSQLCAADKKLTLAFINNKHGKQK